MGMRRWGGQLSQRQINVAEADPGSLQQRGSREGECLTPCRPLIHTSKLTYILQPTSLKHGYSKNLLLYDCHVLQNDNAIRWLHNKTEIRPVNTIQLTQALYSRTGEERKLGRN